jgi:gluconolactonase
LVAPGAELQKLATDFLFTEGPAADADGDVYFTDIPNQRIHKWSPAGGVSLHRADSGYANGLFFDHQEHLAVCEGGSRKLTLDDLEGHVTVLADSYEGKKLNSPNDLWIDPGGGIYFTDPRYGNLDGLEQDGMHVYYLAPDRRTLTRVCSDLKRPNGLIGTPDGKSLYIADEGDGRTWRYAVAADGSLKDKRLFVESGSDGMTMDEKGNVYLTAATVQAYAPDGRLAAEIKTPERPSNVTFAGKDGRLLFITARSSVYAIQMSVKGALSTNWNRPE